MKLFSLFLCLELFQWNTLWNMFQSTFQRVFQRPLETGLWNTHRNTARNTLETTLRNIFLWNTLGNSKILGNMCFEGCFKAKKREKKFIVSLLLSSFSKKNDFLAKNCYIFFQVLRKVRYGYRQFLRTKSMGEIRVGLRQRTSKQNVTPACKMFNLNHVHL